MLENGHIGSVLCVLSIEEVLEYLSSSFSQSLNRCMDSENTKMEKTDVGLAFMEISISQVTVEYG